MHKVSIDEMKAKVNATRILGSGSTQIQNTNPNTTHTHRTVHVLSHLLRNNQHNGYIYKAQIHSLYVQHIYYYSANESTSEPPRISDYQTHPSGHL